MKICEYLFVLTVSLLVITVVADEAGLKEAAGCGGGGCDDLS